MKKLFSWAGLMFLALAVALLMPVNYTLGKYETTLDVTDELNTFNLTIVSMTSPGATPYSGFSLRASDPYGEGDLYDEALTGEGVVPPDGSDPDFAGDAGDMDFPESSGLDPEPDGATQDDGLYFSGSADDFYITADGVYVWGDGYIWDPYI